MSYRRRDEARVLRASELTASQRSALNHVSELLVDALGDTSSSTKPGSISKSRRATQIAFIDGERGAGKTALMLTVQALATDKDFKKKSKKISNAAQDLAGQQHRIVWLPTLDMEPQGLRAKNLFAAVVARVAWLLNGREERGRSLAAALGASDAAQKAREALTQLQQHAVVAWEKRRIPGGNQQERASLAASVMQAEMAWLQLAPLLDQALTGVGEVLEKPDPLFVFPIDDFDLAPAASLDLLRLLRAITHPRLFVVAAGNSRLVEEVLIIDQVGDLARVAGEYAAGVMTEHVYPAAYEVGNANLRKLLPPNQRARIEKMSVDEVLALKPEGCRHAVREAMQGLKLPRPLDAFASGTTSLADLLTTHERWYRGIDVLKSWPRQAVDLAHSLERLESASGVTAALREEFGRRITNEFEISVAHRKRLRAAIQGAALGGYGFNSVFKLQAVQTFLRKLERRGGPTLTISVLEPPIWTVRAVQTSEIPDGSIETALPSDVAAMATVVHDLEFLADGTKQPISLLNGMESFATVGTYWGPVVRGVPNVRWHPLRWQSLRGYEGFVRRWNAYSDTAQNSGEFAHAWVAASLGALFEEPITDNGFRVEPVRRLLRRLVEYPDLPKRRAKTKNAAFVAEMKEAALVAFGLLFAPESGAPNDQKTVDAMERALKDPSIAQRIRTWRALTFVQARRAGGRQNDWTKVGQLYAAICPAEAERVTRGELHNAMERRAPVPSAGPVDDEVYLEFARAIRRGETGGLDQVTEQTKMYAERFLGAHESGFREHPINMVDGGVLVPSAQDIQDADPNSPGRVWP